MKDMLTKNFLQLPEYIKPYPFILLLINLATGIIAPLFVLFLSNKGITLLEIGILSSVFEVCISLFEIPTGYIADKLGRKISVLCCFICFTISGVLYILSGSYLGYIFASGIQGIGYTFVSGALQAWCVDMLKFYHNEDMIKDILISGTQARRAGLLLGSIVGGYIGIVKMELAWMTYIIISVIGFIYTLLFMKEYSSIQSKDIFTDTPKTKLSISDILVNSSKYILLCAIALFAVTMIYEFALSPIEEYWTIHFSDRFNIDTRIFGWLITLSYILLIILIKPIISLMDKKIDNIKLLILIKSLVAMSITLFAFASKPVLAIAAFLCYKFFSGLCEPITETFLNSIINDKYRATILSVYSMAGSAGEIISGVLAGFIAFKFGLLYAFALSSIFVYFTLIIYFYIQVLGKKSNTDIRLSI